MPPEAATDGLGRLAGAMAAARVLVPRTDNVGRSGDERDLYGVIELLAGGVKAAHPASACQAGCSACCSLHKALFRIFRSEWDAIFDHVLETWPSERIAAFSRRFWAETGPYLPLLERIQRQMDGGERIRPPRSELPIDCAFLAEDRCSVYPVRAAICRGFGYFGLRRSADDPDGDPPGSNELPGLEIYSCNLQREALAQRPPGPRIQLPVFNTVYGRLETLCDGQEKRLIPLWIARSLPKAR